MSCCDTPGLLPIEQAKQKIRDAINQISDTENCPVPESVDRILAEEVVSTINVPPLDNSAMDGYAVRYQDLQDTNTLTMVGKSFAGSPFSGTLQQGQCIRIMTGAIVPEGANAVVMQENAQANGEQINFLTKPKQGLAIRLAGEDIAKGQAVFEKGRKLSAIDIGLLASLGVTQINVFRKVKVALFSTGDELKQPGETLAPGDIYDSNRPTLKAMLHKLNVEVLDLGVIEDNKTLIEKAFSTADAQADVVITSGGVSVGEADFTKDILEQMGQINFWKLAIKPGKPFAFGQLPNSYFFGLPGNPVSSMVTFHQLALPAIETLAGRTLTPPLILKAITNIRFRKSPGRTDYQRAVCITNEHGELEVQPTGSQGSGILSSIANANCYVILEQDRGNVEIGETVSVQLFDHFFKS